MSDTTQMPVSGTIPDPLQDVWNVIVPLLVPERADDIMRLVKGWMKEELTIYSKMHDVDDVTCGIELTHCEATFDLPEVGEASMIGYRLLLNVCGTEPQHPPIKVDCFFQTDEEGKIFNLILSTANAATTQARLN